MWPGSDAAQNGRTETGPAGPHKRLHGLARHVLAATAICCGSGAVLLVLAMGDGVRWGAAGVFLLLGAAAWAARGFSERAMRGGLLAVQLAVACAIVGVGAWQGWGLAAPGLLFNGLLVCVLCAAAGWQAGAVLALWSAGLLMLMPHLGPAAELGARMPPMALQLGVHLMVLAVSLAAGWLLSGILNRGMQATDAREQRFRRLLALAADGYWEIDAQYRLQVLTSDLGQAPALTPQRGLGAVPWELPQWQCDAETLDVLLADLDSRLPFRDLQLHWSRSDGRRLALQISGEPRFDQRGIFTGYWGVVHDVTAREQDRAALDATETRYRELFSRIPTPLLLHRNGHVFDANAAALALFGQPDLPSLMQVDLLACYEAGDSRDRARRRIELLRGQPVGTALPVTDFKLVLPDRQLSVRATSVRVDAEGGPATLAIYVDDTERLAASEAVRRSEALLSALVATSPDLITLTDVATGRYAMVNRSFERLTGWTASEVIGRTSLEIGIWGQPDARLAFVSQLARDGSVTDFPTTFVNRAGEALSLLVSAAPFRMDQRDYMVINARDVTAKERERLEREAILQSAPIGIAVTRRRRVELANPHFEQIFGWGPGELIGQHTSLMWADQQLMSDLLPGIADSLQGGRSVELEHQALRKDGSTFTAQARGHAIDPKRPLEGGLLWIVEDVTANRQAAQALARARDEAEAANRAKSIFLANTSHELRTPLNGLIGLSRLARNEALDADRRQLYLAQIENSAQSLAGIISDILDLSRIEAGKLSIETSTFDLAAELQAVQRTYGVLAETRGLELRLELGDPSAALVRGDALRVRQIVSNFIVNALKFTERGGVQLSARRLPAPRQALIRLEVQDSGPGIAADTLGRLFKPFTQADASTTRRYGGTGLGLSICHELATLMGGQVGATSQPGQGSCFWAELPLPAADAPPAASGAAAAPVEAPGPPRRETRNAPRNPQRRKLHGLRVLMAEDNAVNMMIAVAMLESWGVVVTQATDGREAVAAVAGAHRAGQPFDAVLMDVHMPVMSGHEATREVRLHEAAGGLRRLPVIALTAAALVTERDEALRAGMDDFLTKPIDAERLHDTLQRWCVDGG
jgi:PAS domain S-box-containing protein